MGLHTAVSQSRRALRTLISALAAIILLTGISAAQQPAPQQEQMPWAQDLKNYPGLMQEFEKFFNRVQVEVQPPAVRQESNTLRLLPNSTLYYAAVPNYGDAAHQTLAIFHNELQQSPVLRDWWQHGELAKNGPMLELSVEKFSEFSQYIGDEIVIAGGLDAPEHAVFVIAPVRKAGLKDFLKQTFQLIPSPKPPVRVLDPQELAAAKDDLSGQNVVVLVRNDFLIAAPSVKAARGLNDLVEGKAGTFAATPFGLRLEQSYQGGVSALAGADLERLLKQVPTGPQANKEVLERTGFADIKYAIWEHKNVNGRALSQMEVSFNGPRHGIASWLAAPTPLNSVDFASPKSAVVMSMVLENFSKIFDDIHELAIQSNPNAWASLDQMQQAMNLNLKSDLLSHFEGEIAAELDSVDPKNPAMKIIFRVNDPEGLQRTLQKLLAAAPFQAEQSEEDGITYYVLHVPSAARPLNISYAFVDGYLVLASSREGVSEAVEFHRNGGSLRSSAKFQAALPPGHAMTASALFYEDPVQMSSLWLRQVSPEMVEAISQMRQGSPPLLACAYGEESAIRSVSTNSGTDAAAVLIGAAIAIPNVLRARIAANESSAVGTLRTLTTAEIVYSTSYPQKGFARDLASLGPDPRGTGVSTSQHASIIPADLGSASCTAGAWCEKTGYKFTIKTSCSQAKCREYVIVATPAGPNTGAKNFCSTSDGVTRYEVGQPLSQPISASQCRTWAPVQ